MTPAELVAIAAAGGLCWFVIRKPPQRPGHPPDPPLLLGGINLLIPPDGLRGVLLGPDVPEDPLGVVVVVGATSHAGRLPADPKSWRGIANQLRGLQSPADVTALADRLALALGLPAGTFAPLSAVQILALLELLADLHRKRLQQLRRGLLRPAAILLAGGFPAWLNKSAARGAAQ